MKERVSCGNAAISDQWPSRRGSREINTSDVLLEVFIIKPNWHPEDMGTWVSELREQPHEARNIVGKGWVEHQDTQYAGIKVKLVFGFFPLIYFCLCWVFIALVAAARGCSVVVVLKPLIAAASLVVEHGL